MFSTKPEYGTFFLDFLLLVLLQTADNQTNILVVFGVFTSCHHYTLKYFSMLVLLSYCCLMCVLSSHQCSFYASWLCRCPVCGHNPDICSAPHFCCVSSGFSSSLVVFDHQLILVWSAGFIWLPSAPHPDNKIVFILIRLHLYNMLINLYELIFAGK